MHPYRQQPTRRVAALLLFLATTPVAAQDVPTFAELGTCPTASGEVVMDCRIAYRTAGTLNAARDNAILIPTWYGGSSKSLHRLLGAGAMVDTTRFFVVLVDALGDGVSTSPSNSAIQPGARFPRLTVADMVDAQHRLVREHLELSRLHAVLGFSLGGMQALEWAVRYPDVAGSVVSLHGTPRLAPHDIFTMRALRWMLRVGDEGGTLPPDSASVPLVDLWHVIAYTPERENQRDMATLDSLVLREAENWKGFHREDNRLQLEALLAHDIARDHGGDLARAAKRVRARMLIVVSPDDRILGHGPSLELAELAGAEVLSVRSACGHFALYCEPEVGERVRGFLEGSSVAVR